MVCVAVVAFMYRSVVCVVSYRRCISVSVLSRIPVCFYFCRCLCCILGGSVGVMFVKGFVDLGWCSELEVVAFVWFRGCWQYCDGRYRVVWEGVLLGVCCD